MKLTKEGYIKGYPKSKLAAALKATNWPDKTEINVIGGLNAPHTKCSNLYHALQRSKLHEYVLGGHRQRGTEGWWIAVA